LEDQDVDRKKGTEWSLGRLVGGLWSGFSWLKMGPLAGCCVYGDEPSSSVITELVKEGDVGHVARMRNEKNTHTSFLLANIKERDQLGDSQEER
jgi:hypothetical protein